MPPGLGMCWRLLTMHGLVCQRTYAGRSAMQRSQSGKSAGDQRGRHGHESRPSGLFWVGWPQGSCQICEPIKYQFDSYKRFTTKRLRHFYLSIQLPPLQ